MYADINQTTGRQLQSIINRSKSPIAQCRAAIIMDSAFGSSIQEVAERYYLPEAYVEQLIRAFNRVGIQAVREGTRSKAKTMRPEEISRVIEVAQMPPSLLGASKNIWLLSEFCTMAVERNVVQFVDINIVRTVFDKHGIPYEDDITQQNPV